MLSKYYHESSATVILNEEGREIIDQELEKIRPICDICKTELIRISMMEGDCVVCPVDMYKHPTSWTIVYNIRTNNPPYLKKRNV